jgi:hypothetical protein
MHDRAATALHSYYSAVELARKTSRELSTLTSVGAPWVLDEALIEQ